jgi:hypothetical protein
MPPSWDLLGHGQPPMFYPGYPYWLAPTAFPCPVPLSIRKPEFFYESHVNKKSINQKVSKQLSQPLYKPRPPNQITKVTKFTKKQIRK